MKERFTADSVMTPDGEVMPLALSTRRDARSPCRPRRSLRTAAWSARSRDMSICSALAFGVPAAMRES